MFYLSSALPSLPFPDPVSEPHLLKSTASSALSSLLFSLPSVSSQPPSPPQHLPVKIKLRCYSTSQLASNLLLCVRHVSSCLPPISSFPPSPPIFLINILLVAHYHHSSTRLSTYPTLAHQNPVDFAFGYALSRVSMA